MSNRRNTPYDKKIGNRLRQLRLNKGLSQTDLGMALGVTFQQIQKYETGANAIASTRMPALCKALGIDSNELYKINGVEELNIRVTTFRTALRLEKLPSHQRTVINNLIEAFEKENLPWPL
jgi:transcriptional regulator with XRE-family HTH domain